MKNILNRSIAKVLLVFIVTCSWSAAYAGTEYPEIGRSEARLLVHEALKSRGSGIDLDNEAHADDPGFYFFGATWPNPTGSPVIGYFAVNSVTGDIWDQGCRLITTPSVQWLQSAIRKKLNLTGAAYEKLHAKKPIC